MITRDAPPTDLQAIAARLLALEAAHRTAADRQAIQDVLCRYSRALDRLDAGLLRGAFWPDARVDLGPGLFQGPVRDFFDFAMAFQGAMIVTRHELTNVLVEFSGDDAAFAESYVRAFHVVTVEGGAQDLIVYGRYLDHFQRREAEWRIARRTELLDWAHERPATADWFARQPAVNRGRHAVTDELYAQRGEGFPVT